MGKPPEQTENDLSIDDLAMLITDNHPIPITVMSDTNPRTDFSDLSA